MVKQSELFPDPLLPFQGGVPAGEQLEQRRKSAYYALRHIQPWAIRNIRAALDLGYAATEVLANYEGQDRDRCQLAIDYMAAHPEVGVCVNFQGDNRWDWSEEAAKREASRPTGAQLKKDGMAKAAAAKSTEPAHARVVARCIAEGNGGLCHADLVADALEKGGRAPLGNAAGQLFQTDDWEPTDDWIQSERPHAHRNRLRVWRLRNVN